MGFGCETEMKSVIMAKNPFLNFPPEFYKNLFAASALYTHQQQNSKSTTVATSSANTSYKAFKAQNFPRNLLYSTSRSNEDEVQHVKHSQISFIILNFM